MLMAPNLLKHRIRSPLSRAADTLRWGGPLALAPLRIAFGVMLVGIRLVY